LSCLSPADFGFSGELYRTRLGWNECSVLNIPRSLAEPVPQTDVHDATGNSELIAWMAGMLYLRRLFYYHLEGGNRIEAVRNVHGDGTPPAESDVAWEAAWPIF
jgi:hypothetical protein